MCDVRRQWGWLPSTGCLDCSVCLELFHFHEFRKTAGLWSHLTCFDHLKQMLFSINRGLFWVPFSPLLKALGWNDNSGSVASLQLAPPLPTCACLSYSCSHLTRRCRCIQALVSWSHFYMTVLGMRSFSGSKIRKAGKPGRLVTLPLFFSGDL